uniref:Uncharacterized protein n=1 Tax=Rhizophora mucronata TaxID=61149 RepID=A0A2P2P3H6_RHIMU
MYITLQIKKIETENEKIIHHYRHLNLKIISIFCGNIYVNGKRRVSENRKCKLN